MIICTEFLEHVEEDRTIVCRLPLGVPCLCSVPSFPYVSHVRHFADALAVEERYGPLLDDPTVLTLRGYHMEHNKFFLFEGRRKGDSFLRA